MTMLETIVSWVVNLVLIVSVLQIEAITPDPTRLGVTTYSAPEGKALACRGHPYTESREWVAVPTEWVLGGAVDCGDLVWIHYDDGTWVEAIPVRDSGCMLHWDVWDTGRPMGIDVPLHVSKARGLRTQTADVLVWSNSEMDWVDISTTAWDTKHCSGPLTMQGTELPNEWY